MREPSELESLKLKFTVGVQFLEYMGLNLIGKARLLRGEELRGEVLCEGKLIGMLNGINLEDTHSLALLVLEGNIQAGSIMGHLKNDLMS